MHKAKSIAGAFGLLLATVLMNAHSVVAQSTIMNAPSTDVVAEVRPGEPAAMLLHFAPGAPREGYFEGLARFATEGHPSEDALAEFYRLHDNHWLPSEPEG